MKYLNVIKAGIAASLMISIASYCNLVCGNKYVGAALFCFGLITVCRYSFKLFTGMAGYINKNNVGEFLLVTVINCVAAFLLGMVASLDPAAKEKAMEICGVKTGRSLPWLLVSSIMCGMLIYIGVDIFKKYNNYIGIFFSIPIFVLCGFDHTVANVFYYGANASFKVEDLIILPVIIVGNILGSNIIRWLLKNNKNNKTDKE